jgi:hypothetical protein
LTIADMGWSIIALEEELRSNRHFNMIMEKKIIDFFSNEPEVRNKKPS